MESKKEGVYTLLMKVIDKELSPFLPMYPFGPLIESLLKTFCDTLVDSWCGVQKLDPIDGSPSDEDNSQFLAELIPLQEAE